MNLPRPFRGTVLLLSLLLAATWSSGSAGSEEMVLVRVFRNAESVANLSCADFRLSEDGAPRQIAGCQNFRRRLAGKAGETAPGRLLALVADIQQVDAQVEETVDFLLRRVLVSGDALWLLCWQRMAEWRVPAEPAGLRSTLLAWLRGRAEAGRSAAQDARHASSALMDKVMADYPRVTGGVGRNPDPTQEQQSLVIVSGVHRHYYMKYYASSLENFRRVLQDYRASFLFPDVAALANLVQAARARAGEKWLLLLRQVPAVPQLTGKQRQSIAGIIQEFEESQLQDENKYAEILHQTMAGLDIACQPGDDFPFASLKNLLYLGGFTCHALFLPPADETLARDGYWRRISAALAEWWQKLCLRTGGLLLRTDEGLTKALEQMADHEDAGCWILHSPTNPAAQHSWRVSLTDPNLKAEYATVSWAEVLAGLTRQGGVAFPQIAEMAVSQRTLRLLVAMPAGKSGFAPGSLQLRVQVADSLGRISYDQAKTLTPSQEKVTVAISLAQLPPGRFNIRAIVLDPASARTEEKAIVVELR